MAARFHFRLEPLRKLREALEREAERHLARSIQAEQAARTYLEALSAERTALFESRRLAMGEALNLDLWRAGERYLVVLERRQVEGYERLRTASAELAAARESLALAHRNHLMLVRLKERRALQHAQEQQLREALAMDELAILRYHRESA
ncbi:flagellar export protein FliJ [Geothrix sp. PMB-07]|uniref:flagellar export protein FliJ n=1 Tax=Geothrix sp. PMB-07 TaxID=3068640 RepID=UPI00274203CD|nr:flagellar export protein FliJ [Geothrix sp. PMB-07]WLT32461.1 flagellar export protein FliJ [Geothrix sp. PMB-07]